MKFPFQRILIFGGNGMLAHDLIPELRKIGSEIVSVDLPEVDITEPSSLKRIFSSVAPDLTINCAAFTAVDLCEEKEDYCNSVNGTGPGLIAQECKKYNSKLVQYSTDYIFPGDGDAPIVEDVLPGPVNAYGRSKLLGEEKILSSGIQDFLIFRIQWLYGRFGKNFVQTMKRLSKEKPEIRVVNDQFGIPSSTTFVSQLTIEALRRKFQGIYHLGPTGFTTWHGFASFVLRESGCNVVGIPTISYPTPAKRPLYSVLSGEKIRKSMPGYSPLAKSWEEVYEDFEKESEV